MEEPKQNIELTPEQLLQEVHGIIKPLAESVDEISKRLFDIEQKTRINEQEPKARVGEPVVIPFNGKKFSIDFTLSNMDASTLPIMSMVFCQSLAMLMEKYKVNFVNAKIDGIQP